MGDRIQFAEQTLGLFQGEVDEVKNANPALVADIGARYEAQVAGDVAHIRAEQRRTRQEADQELQDERRVS
jgi:FtsZ-binding cell division protein ZapB